MDNEHYLEIKSNIIEYGFHMVRVAPEEEHFGRYFVYSIGLFEKYNHPEILIFLYNKDHALQYVNLVAQKVISGGKVTPDIADDRFSNVSMIFKEVDKSNFEEYLGIGVDYYQNSDFKCYQMFWPDIDGAYPWEDDYDGNYDVVDQPLLYKPLNT